MRKGGKMNPWLRGMFKGARFFTLVELLVVIAVIALLASLLMPALKSARDRGYEIACKNQLRQCGLSCVYYADDNNGWMRTYDSRIGFGWWEVAEIKSTATVHRASCPSAPVAATNETYGIFLNTSLTNVNVRETIPVWVYYTRITAYAMPSTAHYLADSADSVGKQCSYYYPYNNGDANVCLRHERRANVWFMDAHVDGRDRTGLKAVGFSCARLPDGPVVTF